MKKVVILLFLIYTALSHAGVTGKLSGKITDASTGEPLVGANIEVVGSYLGAAVDADGIFIILNIPPGNISVQVSYVGYETTVVKNVQLMIDQTTQLSLKLKPSNLTLDEAIVVTADRVMIQKDITSSISIVRREEIESLPVTRFTELLTLQPGVVGEGNNFYVRGGRSNEISYLIDGTYVSDPLLGGLAAEINNDAIQEMSLLSGTFNAEYGNALSGVVNIVTREGGKDIDGKIEVRTSQFGVTRYADLDEFRINGFVSGPLFSQKLRFFLSAEHDNRGSYLPFGYNKISTIFSKLSFQSHPGLKFTWSNRGSKSERQGYDHSWKYIPEQSTRRRTDSFQSVVAVSHMISKSAFYDLRLSYFEHGYYSGVDKDTSEYITSSQREYFEEYGNGVEFYSLADPLELTEKRTKTADFKFDLVMQPDDINELKFGLQYKRHWLDLYYIYDPQRDNPYIDDYVTSPFEAAAYVQDKIELPFLIINLGLRFDYANANVSFREDPLQPASEVKVKPRMQISPRLGISHPVSEYTKLHFSYGHFFQNPDYRFLFENKKYDIDVREPIFGQPNLDAESTISYEVGLAHQFSNNTALHLAIFYKDVTDYIGTHYYEFKDAYTNQYTAYTLYVNEDYANIKGFEANLDMRPSEYFSGGLTYTYQIAKGSASSETEQYPGTQESTKLYYLDFDKTHVFNASGTYRIPKKNGPSIFGSKILGNTEYSLIFRVSSGYPYTPSGRDIGFVDRNSLRQPASFTIDLELSKSFDLGTNTSLRLFVQIFNLTDTKNVVWVYRDTGDPEFTSVGGYSEEYMKDPSNYGPPRVILLGLGLRL
jgi:outer membrane receptor for ferrienterochelin and colicin